jgi:hypothetical protein
MASARETLGEETATAASAEGEAMTLDEAVADAPEEGGLSGRRRVRIA